MLVGLELAKPALISFNKDVSGVPSVTQSSVPCAVVGGE
jgi:hypothetical protein